MDIDSNRYFTLPVNKINVKLRDDGDARKIEIDMRFLNTGRAWKVTGIDKSRKGLICLSCELDTQDSGDNLELEIVNYYSYVYTLSIENGDSGEVYLNNIFQINAALKLNDSVIEDPQIIYTSSNPDIASVDTIGVVTGLGIGNCNITAIWVENENILDSISIDVVGEPIIETYTLDLKGNSQPDVEIKSGITKTYSCQKRNGQGIQVDSQFDFMIIPGSTPSSAYIFSVLNDTQASIKANSYLYYITLRATDRQDSNLFTEKIIKLRGML